MYVPEGMCMVRHRKPFTGGGAGYFIHDSGHMIPRNDVLMVLIFHLIKKKEGCGESDAEHILFNDFVQKKK